MLSPAPLLKLATDYWKSQTFLNSVKLNVYGKMGSEPHRLDELSNIFNIRPSKLRSFLGALCELKLLEYKEGLYTCTDLSQLFLNPDSPASLLPSFSYSMEMYPLWENLDKKLIDDSPNQSTPSKKDTPSFLQSMHSRTMLIRKQVLECIKLNSQDTLLDIAAGAGSWSLYLQQSFNLELIDLLEQEELKNDMQNFIEGLGLKNANFISGDYHSWENSKKYDCVLFFGALHQNEDEQVLPAINSCWKHVKKGGRLFILDLFASEKSEQNLFAYLFGLNMVLTNSGTMHELETVLTQIKKLEAYNKHQVHHINSDMPYSLIEIKKSSLST